MQKNNRISEILREFDERFMFHTEQDSGIMVLKVKSMGAVSYTHLTLPTNSRV